jgi:hypothetical protein
MPTIIQKDFIAKKKHKKVMTKNVSKIGVE